jgi:hypothetical protein
MITATQLRRNFEIFYEIIQICDFACRLTQLVFLMLNSQSLFNATAIAKASDNATLADTILALRNRHGVEQES